MNKVILAIAFLLSFSYIGKSSHCHAQNKLYDGQLLKKIKPIAPTSASFGRYGDHPVDLSTGQVPIEIPLYEIKSGDLSVPIKLKYHSGGIKLNQEASWVGLGWNLDFGGSVVRTVNGFPDEKENPEVPDVEKVLEEMDNDPKGDNCYDKYNLWNKAKDYQCSFRPDLFCYNIGNLSGSFFLINDSIVTTASVPIAGCINNNTHRLVSPDGNVYIFNASETTTISSSHVKMPPYTSTYYISSIISPNGTDTIRYNYQNSGEYSTRTGTTYQGVSIINRVIIRRAPEEGEMKPQQEILPIPLTGNDIYVGSVKTVKPQYIFFRGGRITFNLSERKDLATVSGNITCKKLDNIVIERKTSNKYETVKKIEFHYSYFGETLNGSDAPQNLRLCLDSVTELGKGDDELYTLRLIASFDYYGKKQLPAKNAYSVDYWGYYNGNKSSDNIPKTDLQTYKYAKVGNADRTPNEAFMKYGSIKSMTYPTKGKTEFLWEINRVGLANPLYESPYGRDNCIEHLTVAPPDSIFCRDRETGTLDPIKTQSASYSSGHCYESVRFVSHISQQAELCYRIKRKILVNNTHNKYDKCTIKLNGDIIYSGRPDSIIETKSISLKADKDYTLELEANCGNIEASCNITYSYYDPNDENNSWRKYNYPFTGLRIRKMIQYDTDGNILGCKAYDYTDSLNRSSGVLTSAQNMTNVKGCVDISEYNQSKTIYLEEKQNTIVCSELQEGPRDCDYVYSTVKESIFGNDSTHPEYFTEYRFSTTPDIYVKYVPVVSRSFLRGKLLEKKEYDNSGGTPVLVKDTKNFFSIDKRISSAKTGFVMYSPYEITNATAMQHYFYYYEKAKNIREVFIPSNYAYYSEWQHLDSTLVSEYKNGELQANSKTYYVYGSEIHQQPTEIGTCIGDCKSITRIAYVPDVNDSVCSKMYKFNMLTYPVSEKTYEKQDSSPEVLQDGISNEYTKDLNGNIVLSKVHRFLVDGTSEVLYSYNYNKLGRLIEEKGRDGLITSVYWNEDCTYPLVVAEGLAFELLSMAVSQNYSPETFYKNSICRNSHITTYTYSPLVGISSVTDPSGYTLHYNYDGLGRLIKIFDSNGRVLKDYQYTLKRK